MAIIVKNDQQQLRKFKFKLLGISLILTYIMSEVSLNYFLRLYFNLHHWRFFTPAEQFGVIKGLVVIKGEAGFYKWLVVKIFTMTFSPFFTITLALIIYELIFFRKNLNSDRYGTATLLRTEKEIKMTGLPNTPTDQASYKETNRYGILIGGYSCLTGLLSKRDKQSVYLQYLYHYGSQHCLLYAPTGSGKGVGIIIPFCLTYPHSIFVYDLKGENYQKSAGYRQKYLNNKILKFSPMEEDDSSVRFNPLDTIRLGTIYETLDTEKIVGIMMGTRPKGGGSEVYFYDNGVNLLVAVILHIIYTKKNKNLRACNLFLSGIEPDSLEAMPGGFEKAGLAEMLEDRIHVEGYAEIKKISIKQAMEELGALKLIDSEGINLAVKATASLVSSKSEGGNEKTGIIGSATTPTNLYANPLIAKHTEVSDFTLEQLQNNDVPVSCYFIVPVDNQDVLAPLVRLFVTLVVYACMAPGSMGKKKNELTMMLDEFPQMGRMEIVAQALATIRGYRVRIFIIIQDINQLESIYKELSQSIFSNCGVRIAYAPNDFKTSENLSKMVGQTTFVAETVNKSYSQQGKGLFASTNVSTSVSTQETQRYLMNPDEIMNMGEKMIILIEGGTNILGYKVKYFEDPELDARSKLQFPQKSDILKNN